MFFGHARVGDGNVDSARLLEGRYEIGPACGVAFDKGGAGGYAFRRWSEVEDIWLGAFGEEDLDGGEADARCAAYEGR